MSEYWRPEVQPDGSEPERRTSASLTRRALAAVSVAALTISGCSPGDGRGDDRRERPDPAAESTDGAPIIGGDRTGGGEIIDLSELEHEPDLLRSPEEILGHDSRYTLSAIVVRDETAETVMARLLNNLERAYEIRHTGAVSSYIPSYAHGFDYFKNEIELMESGHPTTISFRVLWERKLEQEGRWYMLVEKRFAVDGATDEDMRERRYTRAPDGVLDGEPRFWSVVLVQGTSFETVNDPDTGELMAVNPRPKWVVDRTDIIYVLPNNHVIVDPVFAQEYYGEEFEEFYGE